MTSKLLVQIWARWRLSGKYLHLKMVIKCFQVMVWSSGSICWQIGVIGHCGWVALERVGCLPLVSLLSFLNVASFKSTVKGWYGRLDHWYSYLGISKKVHGQMPPEKVESLRFYFSFTNFVLFSCIYFCDSVGTHLFMTWFHYSAELRRLQHGFTFHRSVFTESNSALNLFFQFVNIPVHLSFMLLIHKYCSLRRETTENQWFCNFHIVQRKFELKWALTESQKSVYIQRTNILEYNFFLN